ncbi:MAG: amino acid/amide transporter substrate-binding protein family [Acidimicrobiaceae bacterium]|jgi:branched-chain amino acid transport system substrate-binding protein|nr:amino acid/amide transporter substrate-binding protein family [Acidimicrobiaceae bacterium]
MKRSIARIGAPVAVAALALTAMGGAGLASASTSHASQPTYTIAYEGPLSGGNAQLGLNMKFAVQLAVSQANAGTTFGKLAFKLKFLAADDGGSATQSPSTAQSLIGNKSVIAVVGPAFSGATKAAEPLFHAANLATVSPSATNPALATQGWSNFFRVVADDNAQGPGDATYAVKKLGAKKIYTVDDASSYAVGLVQAFDQKAQQLGATVTHQEAPGTTQCQAGTGNVQQYGALATQIQSSHDPVTFYAGYYCDFALLAKALRADGYSGQLLSDDGSLDPHYVSEAGTSVASGTVISCACTNLTKAKADTTFSSKFKKLAGFAVGTYSAEAYDASNTIIATLKKLGTASIKRSAVVKGLHSIVYTGLTKTVHFQKNGNIAGSTVYEYKVENGNIVELGPVNQLVG